MLLPVGITRIVLVWLWRNKYATEMDGNVVFSHTTSTTTSKKAKNSLKMKYTHIQYLQIHILLEFIYFFQQNRHKSFTFGLKQKMRYCMYEIYNGILITFIKMMAQGKNEFLRVFVMSLMHINILE